MRDTGSPKIPLAVLLLFTVLGSSLAFSPSQAFASVGCGYTITTNATLNANIGPCSGPGLVVDANGITLNCAGYAISGASADAYAGIDLNWTARVTVENCNVTGFMYGFLLNSSVKSTLSKNTADSNDGNGFELDSSNSSALTGNTANNNSFGFYLSSSNSSALTGNTANSNSFGFYLSSSSSNTLPGNTANNNSNDGFYIYSSNSSAFTGNTANSNSFGFYLDIASDSSALTGNTANSNSFGFYLSSSNSSALTGNTANSNSFGFYLSSSDSNTFTGNTANNNSFGFYLDIASDSNTLTGNTANGSTLLGYSDVSTGPGTARTANFYTGDFCYGNGLGGSSPSGLCASVGISLSPSSGKVGTTVSISGFGLIALHSLTVKYDGSTAGMPTTCTADASGNISSGCTFTVPSSVLGPHTVIVSDGTYSATAAFTVTPFVSVTPASGYAGTIVTISGGGFVASQVVSATFDSAPLSLSGACTTTSTGVLSGCTFTVPVSVSGLHTVTVSDGNNSLTATFTVISSVSVTPTSGKVGSTVTISGSGFAGSRVVSATFDSAPLSLSGACTTAPAGALGGCTFTVPLSVLGPQTVTVSDGTNSPTATFTVTPFISLTPSLGIVGTTVAVTGIGLAALQSVTLTSFGSLGPVPLSGTCATDASGNLSSSGSCAFTVPNSAPIGVYTLTFGGGTNSPTATFTVTLLRVTCSPSSVVVGSATKCSAIAQVAGPAPTGSVAWSSSSPGKFSSTTCKLSRDGSYSACSVKFTPAAAGSSLILTANYGGDSKNPPTAGAYNLIVTTKATKTIVSCSPSSVPAASSKTVTCKARVTGYSPTGTMTWSQSGTGSAFFVATTCTLSKGSCSVTMTGARPGSVAAQASYGGDPNNAISSGTRGLKVGKALTTVTIVCSSTKLSVGVPVRCTATVSGYFPTGTVTWARVSGVGRVTFSSKTCTFSSGSCSVTVTATKAGSVKIKATYSGDPNNVKSVGTVVL